MVYLVCFDLSEDTQGQMDQIKYWLDFLHSFLGSTPSQSKWKLILIGTRSDLNKSKQSIASANPIPKWQQTWPNLPLHPDILITSKTNKSSIDHILEVVKHECKAIMSTTKVPTKYLAFLKAIHAQVKSQRHPITHLIDLQKIYPEKELMPTLKYLHAVGSIVMVEGIICTDPTSISDMMAKFISPESVQLTLPHVCNNKVEILTSDQVGKVLMMQGDDPKYVKSNTY